jgi:hypothetical protein
MKTASARLQRAEILRGGQFVRYGPIQDMHAQSLVLAHLLLVLIQRYTRPGLPLADQAVDLLQQER